MCNIIFRTFLTKISVLKRCIRIVRLEIVRHKLIRKLYYVREVVETSKMKSSVGKRPIFKDEIKSNEAFEWNSGRYKGENEKNKKIQPVAGIRNRN